MPNCKSKRADGQPCKATVLEGKEHCWQHDPERKGVVGSKGLTEEDLQDMIDAAEGKTILPDRQLEKLAELIAKNLLGLIITKNAKVGTT